MRWKNSSEMRSAKFSEFSVDGYSTGVRGFTVAVPVSRGVHAHTTQRLFIQAILPTG